MAGFGTYAENEGYGPEQGSLRVLVMDDEPAVLTVTEKLLSRLGYDVETAPEGASAVEKYRLAMESGRPFHVVLMDLTVQEGMGGREAMAELRAIDPGVRGIMSSGYSSSPDLQDYKAHGFSEVVAKPFRIEDLREKIDSVLQG